MIKFVGMEARTGMIMHLKKTTSHNVKHSYKFLPLLRLYGVIIICLMLLLLVAFVIIIFPTMETDERLMFFLGWLPFFVFGGYLFWRHSGEVHLTKDAIVLHRFGHTAQMAYQDVIDIKTHDWWLPSNFVFSSVNKRLRFSTQLNQLPLLYHFLRYRLPALQAYSVRSFPWRLQPQRRYIFGEGVSALVLLVSSGFGIRWGIERMAHSSTGNNAVWLFVLVVTILIIVTPFGLVWVHSARVWRFSAEIDQISIYSAWNKKTTWPIQTIRRISIAPRHTLASTAPQLTETNYVICITMVDESRVVIDLAQVSKWRMSLETFFYSLHYLYQNQPIQFVVLGQQVFV
ncbi:MAG: hypothetical protein ACPG8W_03980 [Candidatus Promineifilaceae bacterium]